VQVFLPRIICLCLPQYVHFLPLTPDARSALCVGGSSSEGERRLCSEQIVTRCRRSLQHLLWLLLQHRSIIHRVKTSLTVITPFLNCDRCADCVVLSTGVCVVVDIVTCWMLRKLNAFTRNCCIYSNIVDNWLVLYWHVSTGGRFWVDAFYICESDNLLALLLDLNWLSGVSQSLSAVSLFCVSLSQSLLCKFERGRQWARLGRQYEIHSDDESKAELE